jgi:hypothetical protein
MVPGQRVHMSVYRRMMAHHRHHDLPQYTPRALLAYGFRSWEEALANPDHKMWVT